MLVKRDLRRYQESSVHSCPFDRFVWLELRWSTGLGSVPKRPGRSIKLSKGSPKLAAVPNMSSFGQVYSLLLGWIFRLYFFGFPSYFLFTSRKLDFLLGIYSTQVLAPGQCPLTGRACLSGAHEWRKSLGSLVRIWAAAVLFLTCRMGKDVILPNPKP